MTHIARGIALLLVLPPLWPLPVSHAQEAPRDLLNSVRSLRCEFPTGSFVNLAKYPPAREDAPGPTVVYDNIDRIAQSARVIGTTGTDDLLMIVGENALTFIEMAPRGTPMVTIVYAIFRPGTRELLAVHSRHYAGAWPTEDMLMVGQYYGSCERFE